LAESAPQLLEIALQLRNHALVRGDGDFPH
jgi:hypothetical protein